MNTKSSDYLMNAKKTSNEHWEKWESETSSPLLSKY